MGCCCVLLETLPTHRAVLHMGSSLLPHLGTLYGRATLPFHTRLALPPSLSLHIHQQHQSLMTRCVNHCHARNFLVHSCEFSTICGPLAVSYTEGRQANGNKYVCQSPKASEKCKQSSHKLVGHKQSNKLIRQKIPGEETARHNTCLVEKHKRQSKEGKNPTHYPLWEPNLC